MAYGMDTRLVHGAGEDEATGAVVVPIYQTSTFRQHTLGEVPQWEYSRSGNPTRASLEQLIANLEGGSAGFAFASGMAALTAVLSLLESGDEVLISPNVYGGTFRILDSVFTRFGIGYRVASGTGADAVEESFTANVKAVLLESPSNPLLSITDIRAVSEVAHAHGALAIVDNTFMTPWLQRPLELGADIVVHSATKYLGGHSDLVAGLAVVASEELAQRISFLLNATGPVLGPFDSFLLTRGIKTLGVRMDRHVANAEALAAALVEAPGVDHVYYPGLPSHPGHDIHQGQASGGGAIVSFELAEGYGVQEFFDGLRIVALAESLGGVESLASHSASMTHAAIPREKREAMGITDRLIRVSVGIETGEDIVADVLGALASARM